MAPPTVSIVLNTYNRAGMLKEAIESVRTQTYRDWELIVVDDGSTDETATVVASFVAKDPRIRLIRQPNGGMSAARNTGIGAARGSYIAFLDDDDLWLSQKLERQVAAAKKNPHLGLIYTQLYNDDLRTGVREIRPRRILRTLKELYRGQNIMPTVAMVRRDVFEEVGMYDLGQGNLDDYDLWLRLTNRFEFDGIEEPLAIRRIHGKNSWNAMRTSFFLRRAYERFTPDPKHGIPPKWRRWKVAQLSYHLGWLLRKEGRFAEAALEFRRACLTDLLVGLHSRPETKFPWLKALVDPWLKWFRTSLEAAKEAG